MAQIVKPIYFSKKLQKYYFNDTSVFGDYHMAVVYDGIKLKGGEIKTDKNGRQYILGYVEQVLSKNGYTYWRCTGYVPTEKENEPTE